MSSYWILTSCQLYIESPRDEIGGGADCGGSGAGFFVACEDFGGRIDEAILARASFFQMEIVGVHQFPSLQASLSELRRLVERSLMSFV